MGRVRIASIQSRPQNRPRASSRAMATPATKAASVAHPATLNVSASGANASYGSTMTVPWQGVGANHLGRLEANRVVDAFGARRRLADQDLGAHAKLAIEELLPPHVTRIARRETREIMLDE